MAIMAIFFSKPPNRFSPRPNHWLGELEDHSVIPRYDLVFTATTWEFPGAFVCPSID